MSTGSLDKLARLAGADTPPPRWLYNNRWPGRTRKLLQIAYSLLSWLTARGNFLTLKGERLTATSGHVEAFSTASLSIVAQGALVLRKASLSHLANELAIDPATSTRTYLADADVLVVLATRNNTPVVIHVADDQMRGDRYRQGSEWAREAFSRSGNDHLIPRIIDYRKHPVGWMLTQQRLPGRMIRAGSLSADALVAHVSAAINALPASNPTGTCQSNHAGRKITFTPGLFLSLLENNHLRTFVQEPIKRIEAWLSSAQFETTTAHRDYCFSNVLFSEESASTPVITGIVDWERAGLGAPVGEDALYFAAFAFAHWRGCSPMTVLCMIWDGVQEPTLERMLDMVRTRFKLTELALGHLSIYLWLSHLVRQTDGISRWTEMNRLEWLLQPSQSARIWMEKNPLSET
ncbi:phosphotransferase [Thauera butanivorans]|uniref:phosphotransferase n=1 Tax=Thauera butanivorans TaxID=86174 RepID=UPI003AB2EB19